MSPHQYDEMPQRSQVLSNQIKKEVTESVQLVSESVTRSPIELSTDSVWTAKNLDFDYPARTTPSLAVA